MILEAIVTSLNDQGATNIAPMGPVIPDSGSGDPTSFSSFDLKPFTTSTTYRNLRQRPHGVLHVTDDVLMFARAAIGDLKLDDSCFQPATMIPGKILSIACRAIEFKVQFCTPDSMRPVFKCEVLATHRFRDFVGFNRARHSVIEAAILATRLDFIPLQKILDEFADHETIINKTGGSNEIEAFQLLKSFVDRSGQLSETPNSTSNSA